MDDRCKNCGAGLGEHDCECDGVNQDCLCHYEEEPANPRGWHIDHIAGPNEWEPTVIEFPPGLKVTKGDQLLLIDEGKKIRFCECKTWRSSQCECRGMCMCHWKRRE